MEEVVVHFENAEIYQRDQRILHDVSFDIRIGEFVYLIGKTGSGKSTLLKTLYGELPIKSGIATITDESLMKIKRRKILRLRRSLGIIFQDFQLLDDRNVEDNLKFVLRATGWSKKKERSDRIEEVLIKVGMLNKIKKYPHEMSGGEQQRIAIARALLNDPEVLIADEPTGNLDPETTEEIMKILFDISNQGKTVIMATHDYDTMTRYPSRTMRCENGRVEEVNLTQAPEFSKRI